MRSSFPINFDCFEDLIVQLRAAGHVSTADRHDDLLHRVAWTTSSELLGAIGAELLQFQRSTPSTSTAVEQSLNRCLEMVRLICRTSDK